MRKVFILALKDLKILSRDKLGMFFIFILPLIYGIFFGVVFPGGREQPAGKIKVAIIDEDKSWYSKQFIEKLKTNESLQIEIIEDLSKVCEVVRLGYKTAYVVLKKGFGQNRGLFWGGQSEIEIGLDPSRIAESGYLKGILTQTYFQALQDIFSNPDEAKKNIQEYIEKLKQDEKVPLFVKQGVEDIMNSLNSFYSKIKTEKNLVVPQLEPVKIKTVYVTREQKEISKPLSSYEITFPMAIVWGLMGCAAGFGISIVAERVYGTYRRLIIAPLTSAHILAGKATACFITCLVVITFLLVIGKLIFGVRLENFAVLLIAVFTSSICFTGLMMLISVIGKTIPAVAGAGWMILLICSMLGGGMVPLFVMPSFMQTLSSISPVKWAIISFEGAIWRGFSLSEIIAPAIIVTSVGIISFSIGVKIFSTRRYT